MSDILKRLERLERDIVAKDSSKRLDMDILLAGLAGENPEPTKPTQAEPSEPVEIDFDEMVERLSAYRLKEKNKINCSDLPQQIIIE